MGSLNSKSLHFSWKVFSDFFFVKSTVNNRCFTGAGGKVSVELILVRDVNWKEVVNYIYCNQNTMLKNREPSVDR